MSTKSSSLSHLAIIMDGNRRWAKQHKLTVLQGHQYVADKMIKELVEACVELKIPYLTMWAFSTENWERDRGEVEGLMNIFRKSFERNAKELHEKGVRLNFIGDLSRFPKDIQTNVHHWVELSKKNTTITVSFALNYGGRDEILRAIKKAATDGADLPTISAEKFSSYLDTKNLPDPDIIIRPGGEKRLSGFLAWQAVYAELYFTDVLMPDFNREELKRAVEEYYRRARRFGK